MRPLRALAAREDRPGLVRFAVQITLLLGFGVATVLVPAGWPWATRGLGSVDTTIE